jgi:type I restriction enzyme, S subunit
VTRAGTTPPGWSQARIDQVATLNPNREGLELAPTAPVHFVPMAAVKEAFGGIDVSTTRPLHEVAKGYTVFRADDVIIAKITPCMENGKLAVIPHLEHGWAFGSTEFHVLRSTGVIRPLWLAHFLSQTEIRREAQRAMTGSAGQLRVPLSWIAEQVVPLAPLPEQDRIIAKIEELFSDLDAGVVALERVRANLKRYRAAVLKAAVEGKLTDDWRAQHPDTEPAAVLLERILTDRRRQWERDQLAKFAQAGKQPPKGWREKYPDPRPPERTNSLELPDCWCSVSLDQLVGRSEYGTSVKCDYSAAGPPVLRIPNIARGDLDLHDIKNTTIPLEITPGDELQKGDMLVCRTNGSISLIGKAALVRTALRPPHTFASYLLRFRFVETEFLPKWTHIFFSSLQGRSFIESHAASSAGQHNVSLSLLNGMSLPLPPHDEQEVIISEVESRLSILDEIEAQIDANLKRADRLRQGILKRAFEGRLVPQDPSDEPAKN